MTAIAILHREEIIQRVEAGEYLASIAQSLGLAGKGQAISNQLAQDPGYQAARETGLEAKLAKREAELEGADPASVPRARELLSHARWRAEREAPHRWGQSSKLSVSTQPINDLDAGLLSDASELLRMLKAKTVEAKPVANMPNAAVLPTIEHDSVSLDDDK